MLASWLVMGVMIALILVAVSLFGGEVAGGALQVSMTLATIFALAVAWFYGYRGSVISKALNSGVSGAIGTVFVVIAIGTVIGALYLSGTVAAFVYYGVEIISPRFFYVTVFLIAAVLTVMVGSSLTTVGAVGIAFVGLANIVGVDPAIAAGAAVSGAVFGNKIAKISDTANLTVAQVGGGLTIEEHSRTVTRTAIPTIVISAIIYLAIGLFATDTGGSVDIGQVQDSISQYFNISLLAFVPVVLIFVLSAMRVPAFLTLTVSAVFAVVLAGFTQHDLIVSIADQGLSYTRAVIEVGIASLATGFELGSGNDQLDTLFSGGGVGSMLTTVWLVLVAAAFGAVVGYTGMLRTIVTPVINLCRGPVSLVLATMLSTIGLDLGTADPYSSIVLSSEMFRNEYAKERLKPQLLSAAIADSGTTVSHIIPWNIHGALFAGTLGVAAVEWGPYTFFVLLTPFVTFAMIYFYSLGKNKIPADQDAQKTYDDDPGTKRDPQLLA
jgi:NhaC family Na+:H+ antiporter